MGSVVELVDDLEATLTGYDTSPSQTHLTSSMASGDLTMSVDDHKKVSAGLVQVGDELMWVDSTSASSVVIPPYGRGYRSSTAASHAAGERVVNKPKFPRVNILRTINEVIGGLYGDLYAVDVTQIVHEGSVTTYELPATCAGVLSVRYETVGPSRAWQPVKRWNYNPNANTTTFPSGKSIDLWQGPIPGYPWRITYKREPTALTSGGTFTDSGLPEYCEDVVKYGAMHRLIGTLDSPRLQVRTVESSQRSAYVETGAAADLSKYYYALYQEALGKAAKRLREDHPPQIHFTRF
ncbi:hypothetical protein [Actinocorallia libanotica]|uniref:Uncharacterized protein n=1 Tax=Actinocorallia libanotica TaxID=46162 RepID=A0ABN1Q0Z4_9ACTN